MTVSEISGHTTSTELNPVVLCVDDEPSILKSLQRLLVAQGIQVLVATSGQQALQLLSLHRVDVIISDMRMPEMNGAAFLKASTDVQPEAYRILLTGYADMESTVAAVNSGKIHRYIQKPWKNEELLGVIGIGIEKQRLLQRNAELQLKITSQNQKLKELNQSLESVVEKRTDQLRHVLRQMQQEHEALVELLFNFVSVNPQLGGQFAQSVAQLAKSLAVMAGLEASPVQVVRRAALLHQLGLLGMDPALYNKPYYQLDSAERLQFMTHPALAQLMLLPAAVLNPVADAIYHQYERFNGDGTPDGQVGEYIPLAARILAIARDFLLHVEQHKEEKLEHAFIQSQQQMLRQQGSYYDPKLVQLLSRLQPDCLQAPSASPGGYSQLSTAELKPGMYLERPLFSDSRILLLPHGHVFNSVSIEKLRSIERKRGKDFSVLVSVVKPAVEKDHDSHSDHS